jgi:hypothetical protein
MHSEWSDERRKKETNKKGRGEEEKDEEEAGRSGERYEEEMQDDTECGESDSKARRDQNSESYGKKLLPEEWRLLGCYAVGLL